ncbi:hypothetical protein ABT076_10590 [Streptomyces sp. NPDC002131]|uniref:hypothetical protein n=1 Tax=Streptomyces sp. NPDC002131 TaxID=3154535 RepID=UPI003327B2CB
MTVLPEPTPTAPAAGQAHLDTQAAQLLAAIEEAMHTPTSFRDQTPVPTIGQAQPVPQPGRAPMSQKAVDDSVRMLSAGVASLPIGGMTALVLHVLGTVDPTQLALGAAAPAALVLAVSALLKRAKAVLPDEHHHHYDGPVYQDQRNVQTSSKGVWVKNINEQ